MKAFTKLNINTAQRVTSAEAFPEDVAISVQDDLRNKLEKMKVLFAEIQEIRKNAEIIQVE